MRLRAFWLAGVVLLAGTWAPGARADVPHLLVFSGTFGYRHGGIPHMLDTIEHLRRLTGAFTAEYSEDLAVFGPDLYRRVDGVVFVQVTGFGGALPADRRADFLRFFACGGAFVGVHASSDSGGGWPEYDQLVGARFLAHPHFGSLGSYRDAYSPDNQVVPNLYVPALMDVTFVVEDADHPATEPWRGRETFRASDEIYRYQSDPRQVEGLRVLVSLDEESDYWPQPLYGTVPNPRVVAGQYEPWAGYPHRTPVAWAKGYGGGRVFYTNLGHNPETWDRIDFQDHLLGGLRWATATRPDRACLGTG